MIQNLKVLSTGSGYICLNITNNKIYKTVICPNNVLFDQLRGYNRFYIHPFYFYKIGNAIDKDRAVNVSAKIFKELDHYTIDLEKVREIEKIDIFKDTTFLKDGYINYNLDWSARKAVAYLLLKRGVNCFYGCESGLILFRKSQEN